MYRSNSNRVVPHPHCSRPGPIHCRAWIQPCKIQRLDHIVDETILWTYSLKITSEKFHS